jgi:hypothetical protein
VTSADVRLNVGLELFGLQDEKSKSLTALNQMRNGHFGHGMQDVFDPAAAEVDFVYLNCISANLLLMRTP